MNILFCGDKNAQKGIFMSAVSLAEHTCESLDIYILTASFEDRPAISEDFAKRLSHSLSERNPLHRVILIDISEMFLKELPSANMSTRFTPFCMLRLFCDCVHEIPDKILYLDTDVLCRDDFSELYSIEMGDADIAGVPDRYGKWFFGNILRHDYLNSGVLLMNMKSIRERGVFEKCRIICRDKKMFMPDQSALNHVASKLILPRRFNEQGRIRHSTVFKHFTTFFSFTPLLHAVTVKPWDAEKLHKTLKIYEFDYILSEYERSFTDEK